MRTGKECSQFRAFLSLVRWSNRLPSDWESGSQTRWEAVDTIVETIAPKYLPLSALSSATLVQHKMSLKRRSGWVVNICTVRAEELSLAQWACSCRPARRSCLRPPAASNSLAGWSRFWSGSSTPGRQGGAGPGAAQHREDDQAQVTRLIDLYAAGERVQVTVYRRRRFDELHTPTDIELLASVDKAHETLTVRTSIPDLKRLVVYVALNSGGYRRAVMTVPERTAASTVLRRTIGIGPSRGRRAR